MRPQDPLALGPVLTILPRELEDNGARQLAADAWRLEVGEERDAAEVGRLLDVVRSVLALQFELKPGLADVAPAAPPVRPPEARQPAPRRRRRRGRRRPKS